VSYPRAKLLELRRREVREGRADLARLRDDADRAAERLRSSQAELRGRKRRGSTAAGLQAEERFRAALRDRVERQREAHRKAAALADQSADSLAEAIRRLEAVERDLAAWQAAQRRADRACEQRAAQEAGDAGFRKRRS
jgi:flagellar biosynthesis chaperone FliJ